ncbi:maker506, partial [Drosophila busckii]
MCDKIDAEFVDVIHMGSSCNDRTPQLYAESIESKIGFWGLKYENQLRNEKFGVMKLLLLAILVVAVLDLANTQACIKPEAGCPNENITFWLYNLKNIKQPVLLNPLHLNPSDFLTGYPIEIIIHGYTGHRDFAPNNWIRPVLVLKKSANVISIDYGPLVREGCYFQAVRNSRLASECLAQLINKLFEMDWMRPDKLHVIGYSLGAQVAGQLSNYVEQKLDHITGLDPAKPLFVNAPNALKLDKSDAEFVDIIHTDPFERGMLLPLGHADFYPNGGGSYQPGCQNEIMRSTCNHDRAPQFYAESIDSTVGFWGLKCENMIKYAEQDCGDPTYALMGYGVPKTTRGSYFLPTGDHKPFALGKTQFSDVQMDIGDMPDDLSLTQDYEK